LIKSHVKIVSKNIGNKSMYNASLIVLIGNATVKLWLKL